MAGMLPGVECARRRRFHGGTPPTVISNTASATSTHIWTRRPSFSLYTTNNESHQAYVSFSERITRNKSYGEDSINEKLDGAAKEAKERLDERLRITRKRENSKEKMNKSEKEIYKPREEPQTDVDSLKKRRRRFIKWLVWRVRGQYELSYLPEPVQKGCEALVVLPYVQKLRSLFPSERKSKE